MRVPQLLVLVLVVGCLAAPAQASDHIRPAREHVVQILDHGLRGTPMAGTGRSLEASGWKWHISPYFIAAIAESESSLGFASCHGNPFNAFGLSSCTTGWAVPYFHSWAHAYDFMGKFLSSRWPTARTTYDFHGYAACSSCWGSSTERHMRHRFGVSGYVRYH